jgi:PEP-CTERM/exosortase A-associated glycosyltransferase
MRVLHVLHNSLPLLCGYSIRSGAILRHQRQQGLDPVVVTSAKNPNPTTALVDHVEGITHFRTTRLTRPSLPILHERALMRTLHQRIEQVIRETRPDIVHAHSPVLVGLPALRAARDHGLPFVYEVRDLWENASVDRGKFRYNSPLYRLARRLETGVLRGADAVVTICDTLKDDLSARVADPSRVFVVGNGVDAEAFDPAMPDREVRARWGLTGKQVIAYVGTFQPYEGLDLLIGALPQVLARRPAAHLVIAGGSAGENTAAETSLQALVDRMGLRSNVTFTGRLPHAMTSGVYAMADVVAYPRRLTRTTALTTPLKPLEAMAMGRAVVSSDVPAMRELVRDGETGVTFSAGQQEGLARGCVRLLEDAVLRRALGGRARAWAVGHRRWDALVGRYHGIYEQLAELTSFGDPRPGEEMPITGAALSAGKA